MQTYLQIKVPINFNDSWFIELRNNIGDIPVNWQKRGYHITMAFIDETAEIEVILDILNKHLTCMPPPVIIFDKIDVFTTNSADTHIINLTTSNTPPQFAKTISEIRNELKSAGNILHSTFRLHITLGRVPANTITLAQVHHKIAHFKLEPITLTLKDVEYRIFRGSVISGWELGW